MIEMVIVVGIMLVLSAIAVPSVLQSIDVFRLNSAATSLENMIELTRFNAVRLNTQIALRQATSNGQMLFYVDLNQTGSYASNDPTYLLPGDFVFNPSTAPAASTTNLVNTQSLSSGGCIAFDNRGVVNYSTCGAGNPVVWFLSLGLPPTDRSGYRAVTVSAMGQTKTWTASPGGSWGTM